MVERRVGILGMGHTLPSQIRYNNDPIFEWLRKHDVSGKDLFLGFDRRHVLADGETVLDILSAAALMAIHDAGLVPEQIDHVIGCISPNSYIVPHDLFRLAAVVGLPKNTLTVPLANDFANFNIAALLSDSLVRTGRAHNVLIAIGGGWSRAVSYTTSQAISAADGAAAAVVGRERLGRTALWTLIDSEVIAQEQNFGQMALYAQRREVSDGASTGVPAWRDPTEELFSGPFFQITQEGLREFTTFGGGTAPLAALRLIQRQGLATSDVTITGHQASRTLLDAWKTSLAPAKLFDTLAGLGNMTVATIPVNLCRLRDALTTPYVVALALAPDMHAHALLLRRTP